MTSLDRPYPHSPEAEEALLGSLLIDPDAIFEVSSFLKPAAFYNESNRWIYEAVLAIYNARKPLDFITLHDELRRQERLEKIGGEGYLIGLLNTVPTAINAESYGRIIEAAALRRQMLAAASQIAQLAYDEAEDVNVVIDRAEQALFSVSEDRASRDLKPIKEIAFDYWQRIEELNQRGDDMIGVPSGFTDLDRLLSGLNKSDLIIVAARPGMGKCVAADTQLVNPATGELTTIEAMVKAEQGALLTLTADYKLRPSQASHFVDDGRKPTYRVRTALGREIKTTLSHPFLTVTGWRPLAELAVGDHVAVPRHIPVFGVDNPPTYEVKVLAYLLADGSLTGASPQFTNSNPTLREDFATAALQFPGNKIRFEDSNGQRTPTLHVTGDLASVAEERREFGEKLSGLTAERNLSPAGLATAVGVNSDAVSHWFTGHHIPAPDNFERLTAVLQIEPDALAANGIAAISRRANSLTEWLKTQEVWGKGAAEKEIPTAVYRYNRAKLALFLNRLFACDGSVYLHKNGQPGLSYSTISLKLAQGVQHLLLRFGVIAKLRRREIKYKGTGRPAYELRVTAADSLTTFIEEIGALGKEAAIAQVKENLANRSNNANLDIIPKEIWPEITAVKGGRSWRSVYADMGLPEGANVHVGQRAPSRPRLLALARALQSDKLAQLAESDVYWDKIEEIEYLGEQQVYDLTVPETHNFVANDVIVHNTAFQTAIALHAAVRHKKRIAMFNLEMSGEQLVQRMIALETRIDSQRLRRGKLQDDEWMIFQEAIGRLSETRIFIDDTPSITPMQLRTKCRRLYAEHGVDLIMVDYLQLMQAERTTNNRVQEISEISRALKGLARELNVPLLAAAQLSRAVEQRQDKRPQLSDLRDSGCLTGETLITMADNGRRIPIEQLVGQSGFRVWALNEENWKIEPAVVSRAFSTGVKPVYKMTTRLGRTIRATGNHQFRAFDGWRRLDQLQAGDRLALPRLIPDPANCEPASMTESEVALLGHLIGDGCTLPRHAIQYTTKEPDLAELVSGLATAVFGDEITPRVQAERQWLQIYLPARRHLTHNVRNPIAEWLDEMGVFGLRSHEKHVPDRIFEQPTPLIAAFLRHLWATDGCVRLRKTERGYYPAVFYASSSKRLVQDVGSLLLRLGINARIKRVSQGGKGKDQYHLILSGKPDLSQFAQTVGAVGAYKTSSLAEVETIVNGLNGNTNRDILPGAIWRQLVVPAMQAQGMTTREMQAGINQPYCGTGLYKQNVSRERAARVADVAQSEALSRLATSDVYWDEIVAIEADGEAEVYDLTVPGPHNFIANDIVAHNSIEQDADIVMFIYRDEYYNPETTERPNIAEIAIAKHRNGPTGTIDLYWQGEFASFRNLQRQEVRL